MEKKRKISIIGSTGSIGTQALEVIEKLQDKFEIIALAGGKNIELLRQQAEKCDESFHIVSSFFSFSLSVKAACKGNESDGYILRFAEDFHVQSFLPNSRWKNPRFFSFR